jgi:hypothetical protein
MNDRELVGCIVWGGLAYGLTKAAEDTAAWFGYRVTHLDEGVLYVVAIFAAGAMLLYVFDES